MPVNFFGPPLRRARLLGLTPVLAAALALSAVPAQSHDASQLLHIDQIPTNTADVVQRGAGNSITIEQRAVAGGFLDGYGNSASALQKGRGHDLGLTQWGAANDINAVQSGVNNSASVGQAGFGLKADVTQTGSNLSVGITQFGIGNGLPVTVNQR